MSLAGSLAEDHLAEGRQSSRTGLFLAATIEEDGRPFPVRLRNMSATGALAEGDILPAMGASVILKRGTLEAPATAVWVNPGRCGLQFSCVISVADWLSDKASGVGSPGQQRVDRIQSKARATAFTPAPPATRPPDMPPATLDKHLAEELQYVQRVLDQMGDRFTSDPTILARHSEALQQFDIVSQILGHIANVVVAPDRPLEASKIGMDTLRRRLLRKTL